jgi:DNA-binding IclR family transcriptional regulator
MYLSSLPDAHLTRYAFSSQHKAFTANSITLPEVLISEIAAIRVQQFSLDREEFMEGMVAIAVPIVGAQGRLVSTLSFHAPMQRISIDKALGFVPALRAASSELSKLLTDDEDSVTGL